MTQQPISSLDSHFSTSIYSFRLGLMLGLLTLCVNCISAQDAAPQDNQVRATVAGYEISNRAVVLWLKKRLPNLPSEEAEDQPKGLDALHPALVKGAVDHLVERRIVFDYLQAHGLVVGKDELRLELDSLQQRLAETGRTMKEYLEQLGVAQHELEFEIQWPLVWQRYLDDVLTDERLEQHFNRHRRRFDRSEIRVAQLLLHVKSPEQLKSVVKRAKEIRDAVTKAEQAEATNTGGGLPDHVDSHRATTAVGNEVWHQAVKEQSEAASASEGGEVGWIRYHEPMPPAFSEAAFELSPGQISQPVVTPIGVHLIRCLELREGKMGFRDSLEQVKQNLEQDLFKRIAKEHRPKVAVVVH